MEAQNHDILEWDGPAIGLLDLDAFFGLFVTSGG